LFDSAFSFFNKYAGQKDPAKSTNAMCALKDAIDASDIDRFPEHIFGTANRDTVRMKKVLAPFIPYGAKLEDPLTATLDDYSNLSASGINDVGWNIFPGNYERYLHQVDANSTSIGFWNVPSRDTGSMFGRFARGFDLANGKNALYFDVDNAFLKNAPLNGAYPVMIEVTYLDSGTGKFQFYYDAIGNKNKAAATVTCTNSGLWKKTGITLHDAYFGDRSHHGADFYIKSQGSQNVIFSLVELARPHANNADLGLFATSPVDFDTLCLDSSAIRSFTVTGLFLDGSKITVGPLKGFKFSLDSDGRYMDSLKITGYGASLKKTIYVLFNPASTGSHNGNVIVKGGGVSSISVHVRAASVRNANLSATITNVSCYNTKDGSIDLAVHGATQPVSYNWVSTDGYRDTTKNIDKLKPSTYTVTVISAGGGCTATGTYTVSQPDPLVASLSADTMICKGGTTNLYVIATGGTVPYTGTGTFRVGSGKQTVTVTDANGCMDKESIGIPNGDLSKPRKPGSITSSSDGTGLCGGGNFTFTVPIVADATSYTWVAPAGCSLKDPKYGSSVTLRVPVDFDTGNLSVTADNVCGISDPEIKMLQAVPRRPGTITGPTSVTAFQTGLHYSVPAVTGITYTWSLPGTAKINAGQNSASITATWGAVPGDVIVTANNDCGSSSKRKLSVALISGATSADIANSYRTVQPEVSIQPNPARNIVHLYFEAPAECNYSLQLVDVAGKSVLHDSRYAHKGLNQGEINITSLANGFYVMIFRNDKGEVKTLKLVKE
jgi:hypothetical protein